MENVSLKEALIPSQGFSKSCEAEVDEKEEMGLFLKTLEDNIHAEYCPRVAQLPFSPRTVLLLGNHSFFLLASYEKVCYFSEANTSVIDISHITKSEIWNAVMLAEDDLVINTSKNDLIRIDMKSVTETFRTETKYAHGLKAQGSFYFLLTKENLFMFSKETNESKSFKFWEDKTPAGLAIKNEFAVVSTTSPGIIVFNLNEETIVQDINTDSKPLTMTISRQLLTVAFHDRIDLYVWGRWDIICTLKTKIDTIVAADVSPGEQFIAACTKKAMSVSGA